MEKLLTTLLLLVAINAGAQDVTCNWVYTGFSYFHAPTGITYYEQKFECCDGSGNCLQDRGNRFVTQQPVFAP